MLLRHGEAGVWAFRSTSDSLDEEQAQPPMLVAPFAAARYRESGGIQRMETP
jgi:hypothetical protein